MQEVLKKTTKCQANRRLAGSFFPHPSRGPSEGHLRTDGRFGGKSGGMRLPLLMGVGPATPTAREEEKTQQRKQPARWGLAAAQLIGADLTGL